MTLKVGNFLSTYGDLFEHADDRLGDLGIGQGVNCLGKMGAGIAATFRTKYPEMYEDYASYCSKGLLTEGDVHSFTYNDRVHGDLHIFNIASQHLPGRNATLAGTTIGVHRAMVDCRRQGIGELALPRIGCGIGGLSWMDVRGALMEVAALIPEVRLTVIVREQDE